MVHLEKWLQSLDSFSQRYLKRPKKIGHKGRMREDRRERTVPRKSLKLLKRKQREKPEPTLTGANQYQWAGSLPLSPEWQLKDRKERGKLLRFLAGDNNEEFLMILAEGDNIALVFHCNSSIPRKRQTLFILETAFFMLNKCSALILYSLILCLPQTGPEQERREKIVSVTLLYRSVPVTSHSYRPGNSGETGLTNVSH